MAKVTVVANPDFCGTDVGGVQFSHGSAEVEDERLLAWFEEHDGYEVAATKKAPAKAPAK